MMNFKDMLKGCWPKMDNDTADTIDNIRLLYRDNEDLKKNLSNKILEINTLKGRINQLEKRLYGKSSEQTKCSKEEFNEFIDKFSGSKYCEGKKLFLVHSAIENNLKLIFEIDNGHRIMIGHYDFDEEKFIFNDNKRHLLKVLGKLSKMDVNTTTLFDLVDTKYVGLGQLRFGFVDGEWYISMRVCDNEVMRIRAYGMIFTT